MTNATQNQRFGWASMTSRGARLQFAVAVALITVIPLLALVCLALNQGSPGLELPTAAAWTAGVFIVVCVSLGYAILSRYPRTVIRLREHLVNIAKGELPETVKLPDDESDINAVEDYLNLILSQMKDRIATIERQQDTLVKVAQKQAMMASLCTACHHIAQPASVVNMCLELLKLEDLSEDGYETLVRSIEAADAIAAVCKRLNNISVYKTEPYIERQEPSLDDINLLDVGIRDGTAKWADRFTPDSGDEVEYADAYAA